MRRDHLLRSPHRGRCAGVRMVPFPSAWKSRGGHEYANPPGRFSFPEASRCSQTHPAAAPVYGAPRGALFEASPTAPPSVLLQVAGSCGQPESSAASPNGGAYSRWHTSGRGCPARRAGGWRRTAADGTEGWGKWRNHHRLLDRGCEGWEGIGVGRESGVECRSSEGEMGR
jgi:hypothetical protein